VIYSVTRSLKKGARGNHANRTVYKGEVFFGFRGNTYGSVNTEEGIALSEYGELIYPFFEFPRDAVEEFKDQPAGERT
jgi:hypothetical protein